MGIFYGMLARDIAIETSDFNHIGVNIAGGINDRAEPAGFLPVIQKSQHYRYICAVCNVIKAGFPVLYFLAGTGRCNHHNHLITLMEYRNQLGDGITGFGSIDRESAQPPEEITHRPEE